MILDFAKIDVSEYHSNAQIARILTESWVSNNMYCPRCGNVNLNSFENNRPVADFFCPNCKNEYELKSKNGTLGKKINDGAYDSMIERITSNKNPDFFFMSYSKEKSKVSDFVFIPKHFFVPDIIEKRKPLAVTAKRAGWVGCNILIQQIPDQGRISIVSNGQIIDADIVLKKVQSSNKLKLDEIGERGWLMDVLNCINMITTPIFTLNDIYVFESILKCKHPRNNNIKPKIRQQLQLLRDKGFIEFLGQGRYKKIF